jgi:Domain of unknown function (DUF397)
MHKTGHRDYGGFWFCENVTWHRSRFCLSSGCLEVASVGEHVAIRDSAQPDVPALFVSRKDFVAFLEGVKHGEFDDLLVRSVNS